MANLPTIDKIRERIMSAEAKEKPISKQMPIGDVVQRYPQTVEVFLRHGLMCFGCAIARFENVEQGAAAHGIDIDALIQDLNAAVAADSN
jgi:hybrid cluster-associated redox disulfide protein